jgi:hypothetical protein
MNRSLDAAVQAARDRAVPWDAKRSVRIAQRITVGRERSRLNSTIVSLAVGGLASAALCASLVQVSQGIGAGSPSDRPVVVDTSRSNAPDTQPEAEPAFVERRPIGDGGDQVSTD